MSNDLKEILTEARKLYDCSVKQHPSKRTYIVGPLRFLSRTDNPTVIPYWIIRCYIHPGSRTYFEYFLSDYFPWS